MRTITLTLLLVVTLAQYQQVNCTISADLTSQIWNLILQKLGILSSIKQPILPKIIAVINPKLSKIFRAKYPQPTVATTIATNYDNYPPPYAPPAPEYGAPPAPPPVEYGVAPAPPPTEYGVAPAPPSSEYGVPPAPPSSEYGVAEAPLPTE
ncbi:uncharacterized protein [Rhodnius prolixus]|uniref:uncharacterized protein n=1 Tax=Rhodnius prolixus TaxID=13249 RepID=UPI003D187FA9